MVCDSKLGISNLSTGVFLGCFCFVLLYYMFNYLLQHLVTLVVY